MRGHQTDDVRIDGDTQERASGGQTVRRRARRCTDDHAVAHDLEQGDSVDRQGEGTRVRPITLANHDVVGRAIDLALDLSLQAEQRVFDEVVGQESDQSIFHLFFGVC